MASAPSSREPAKLLSLGLQFLLGLALVLAATDRAVAAFRKDPNGPKYREMFGGGPPCPNLILGTSRSLHGVNPRQLERPGLPFYNFAFESTNPAFYEAWYADLATYYGRPRLVLFGVDWMFFKTYGLFHAYAQDAEYWPWPAFLAGLARGGDQAAVLLANRFPLVKDRVQFQERLVGVPPAHPYDLRAQYRGFVPLASDRPMGTGFMPNYYMEDGAMVATFERLLDRLAGDGARVAIFQPPEFSALVGPHLAEDARVEAIARAHQLPLLNYNGPLKSGLNTDATLYVDAGHLNARGAEAFGRRFAADLDARGLR